MNILITGGSGYLAGILSKHLSSIGHKIFLLSRNINKLEYLDRNINKIEINWKNKESIDFACKDIDAILHTAGFNAQDSLKMPKESLIFSKRSSQELIQRAIHSNVKKIIFFSSIHVYSNELKGNIIENMDLKNKHPYAMSNIAAEEEFKKVQKQQYIDVVRLRLSNIYGKPAHVNSVDWKLLFNDVCKQAIQDKEVNLNSNGLQKRDLLPSSNFCNFIEYIVTNKPDYNIYNIASGSCFKVIDFVNLVLDRYNKLTNIKVPVFPSNKSQTNFEYSIDISRMKKHKIKLDYSHEKEIDEALKYFINTLN